MLQNDSKTALFMNLHSHLQRSHPVWAVHVEPEAQVTQAHAGWKGTNGGHPGNVTLSLSAWVDVEEVPPATFAERNAARHGVQLPFSWKLFRRTELEKNLNNL